jgi:predicted permease
MPSLKFALRTLFRTPFVTLVAIASLALGIGANTAIFSLIQRVLLRPLPVPDPDRLVNVHANGPNPGSQTCNQAGNCAIIFSYPMFRDLEKGQTVLTGLAGHRSIGADLSFRGRTSSGLGETVSGSYFPVLGIKPSLGRLLTPDDDRTPGVDPVAVLSHHYWANELGADPSLLGESIRVNGRSMTIVGVGPPGFDGTTLGTKARVFVPLTMREVVEGWGDGFENRRSYWVYLFGRLKPGVTRQQAKAQLDAVYSPIVAGVELPLQAGLPEQTLVEFKNKKLTIEPGFQGQSSLHRSTSTPLLLLFAVTAIVLLVACTNVANLLLARAANRASEMAVRSSLGAGRAQLVGQLLTESAVLAVLAGGASIFVAQLTLGLILSFLPNELTRSIDFGLDGPVLLFASGISLVTMALFGLFPAIHSTRPDLLAVTKSSPGRGSAGRQTTRFRNGLVVAQIALSMALLCAAGLFIRSLANVSRVELGIRSDSVVTFDISPGQIGLSGNQSRLLFARATEELGKIPGVTAVASAIVPILRGWSSGGDLDVDGVTTTPESDVNARRNVVSPGYFKALGIPILAGRELTESDDFGSPKVAVVNEAFVEKFKLGTSAIGRRLRWGNALSPEMKNSTRPRDISIVGVVKDAAYNDVKARPQAILFTGHRQDTTTTRLVFYLRTRGSTSEVIRAVPAVIARIEPNLPVAFLSTLPDQIKENVYLDRIISAFSAGFATLATLLAAVGLYGVLAYTVTQRTREIGLRMALGADAGRVRSMVLRQVAGMTALGGVVGIAAAFGIGRAARSLLYQLSGYDLAAFTGAAVILTAIALLAGFAPAVRASRVHPMEALRAE